MEPPSRPQTNLRTQALRQRANRALLTRPEDRLRSLTTPATHDQVQLLQRVLVTTDTAMAAEGVDQQTRDRVVHWILFGEPPPRDSPDPDEAVDRAAQAWRDREELALRVLPPLPALPLEE